MLSAEIPVNYSRLAANWAFLPHRPNSIYEENLPSPYTDPVVFNFPVPRRWWDLSTWQAGLVEMQNRKLIAANKHALSLDHH